MKKLFRAFILLWAAASIADAQTATVSRNVNLRPDPSTNQAPITKLVPGAEVQLIEAESTNGFYHIDTESGLDGWVWGKNIHVQKDTEVSGRVGPARLYPDGDKTPGLADTLEVSDLTKRYTENCPDSKPTCTYSQSHRKVTAPVHKAVYETYKVPQAKRNIRNGEVDHFHPLCAGGSNDIKNLWYQPAVNTWKGEDFGFHAKDRLETFVCQQIKAGLLDPKVAYERITADWVKFYMDEGLNDED